MGTAKVTGVHYLILDKHFTRLGNPSYDVIVVYKKGGSNMYYKQLQLRCYDHQIPDMIRREMGLTKSQKIGKIY